MKTTATDNIRFANISAFGSGDFNLEYGIQNAKAVRMIPYPTTAAPKL
jgi:hypothetical protein